MTTQKYIATEKTIHSVYQHHCQYGHKIVSSVTHFPATSMSWRSFWVVLGSSGDLLNIYLTPRIGNLQGILQVSSWQWNNVPPTSIMYIMVVFRRVGSFEICLKQHVYFPPCHFTLLHLMLFWAFEIRNTYHENRLMHFHCCTWLSPHGTSRLNFSVNNCGTYKSH